MKMKMGLMIMMIEMEEMMLIALYSSHRGNPSQLVALCHKKPEKQE